MGEGSVTNAEEAAFRTLFDATYGPIRAFARRRLPDAAAVDDVVSETYLVAWRRFGDVPREPHEGLMWLYRVAHFSLLNVVRARRRQEALRLRLQASVSASVIRPVGSGEDASAMVEAFLSLSESDQTVLMLAAWEGLRPDELGIVLECGPGAAAMRLARARARFESSLAPDADEPASEVDGR